MQRNTLSPTASAALAAGDIDALLAFHRQTFGGFVMEEGADDNGSGEDAPEESTEQSGDEGDDNSTSEDESTESEESGDESDDEGEEGENGSQLSHEDALKALARTRREAAASRTKLRDLQQQLAEAKTPEQVAEITTKLEQDNADAALGLLRENVALKAGLPDELADALKGTTREELEAHAKVLSKFVPSTKREVDPEDLDGGLNPGDDEDSFDAKKLARSALKRRR